MTVEMEGSSIGGMIPRREALEHCSFLADSDLRILKVEAQAGQGKSVLVRQFEEQSEIPFIWIECSSEHSDARYLLDGILTGLGRSFPDIFTEKALLPLHQELLLPEILEIAPRLLADLSTGGGLDFYLVFDDLHLLQDYPVSKQLIRSLADTLQQCVRFIVISRYPVTADSSPLFSKEESFCIDEEMLAFSREETAALYNAKFAVPVGVERINRLLDITEGWVTGLILLGSSGRKLELEHISAGSELGNYFGALSNEVLPEEGRRSISLLGLMPHISGKILKLCLMESELGWLEHMVGRNFFVSVKDESGHRVFKLHHLLQDHLRTQSCKYYSAEDIRKFMKLLAGHYLKLGRILNSLHCCINARAWDDVEQVMCEHGSGLLARNFYARIEHLLSGIPEEVILRNPWSCYFLGAAKLELAPEECSRFLQCALDRFRELDDNTGELAASAQLISYHVFLSGRFGRRKELVERTSSLLDELHKELPPRMAAGCAQAVSLGFSYCMAQLEDAMHSYELMISALRNVPDSANDLWMSIPETLVLGLKGDVKKGLEIMAYLFTSLEDSWISPSKRFGVMVAFANFLLMDGDFVNYEDLKQRLESQWKPYLENSHLGAFFYIWDLDLLVAQGRYEQVLELAADARKLGQISNPHIFSQILHYEALALAFLRRDEQAYDCMLRGMRLRAESGGAYFIDLNHSLGAAVCSLIGRNNTAERIFSKVLRWQAGRTFLYHTPVVHAYRAVMHMDSGCEESAADDVGILLRHLKRRGNTHFFGWSPDIMKKILIFAVRNRIEVPFARELARTRMGIGIQEDGSVVPLMVVKVVGGFELKLEDVKLGYDDLRPLLRNFMLCLAALPESGRAQRIMEIMWPGHDCDSARNSLYATFSKLKTEINRHFGSQVAARYLVRKGNNIYLENCIVDCGEVSRFGRKGVYYKRKQMPWLAHTFFNNMNEWLPASFAAYDPDSFPDPAFFPELNKYLLQWIQVLVSGLYFGRALEIVELGLSLDPIDDGLQRERYRLLIDLKRPAQAYAGVREYRKALERTDYPSREIDFIVSSMLAR